MVKTRVARIHDAAVVASPAGPVVTFETCPHHMPARDLLDAIRVIQDHHCPDRDPHPVARALLVTPRPRVAKKRGGWSVTCTRCAPAYRALRIPTWAQAMLLSDHHILTQHTEPN